MSRNSSVLHTISPWDDCPNEALEKKRLDGKDEAVKTPVTRAKSETRRTRSRQIPGGIYYVVKRSKHPGQPIFRDASDYAAFEQLLALALVRYRYRLHAFCWEPEAVHLVIQVSDRPIWRFLQWLCGWYSRGEPKNFAKETVFERSYQAVFVEPGWKLLSLIRYLHLRPVSSGGVANPVDSGFSSHRAYLGMVSVPWVTTSLALGMLAPSADLGRLEYRRLMQGAWEEVSSGKEGYRQPRSGLANRPLMVERNVESLQIRAAPVASGKDSRL